MAQAIPAQASSAEPTRSRQARAFATALSAALLGMGIAGEARAADHILNNVTIDLGVFKIEISKICNQRRHEFSFIL